MRQFCYLCWEYDHVDNHEDGICGNCHRMSFTPIETIKAELEAVFA